MKQITVTVKKPFLDRQTGLKRKPGDKFKVSDARYREIKRSGDYVAIVTETKEATKPEKVSEKK